MDNDGFLKDFFSFSYELDIEKKLQKNVKKYCKEEISQYIKRAIAIPFEQYLQYAADNPTNKVIRSSDLSQISCIESCLDKICDVMEANEDRGLSFREIGHALQDDGKERSSNTESRYGLDHTKAARQLGLVRLYDDKWYLSCIGKQFLHIDSYEKNAIVSRSLMRDPLYGQIICDASKNDVHILDYMMDISESTILRRKSSILTIVSIAKKQCDLECPGLLFKIEY